MNAASYVFFGLILIPLVIFLAWIIRKDKSKNYLQNYLGLMVLIAMVILALISIVRYDNKFMSTGEGSRLKKSQMPSYR